MTTDPEPMSPEPGLEQADRRLQEFFQRERPRHWPGPPPIEEPAGSAARLWRPKRSHWALAASLLLFVGGWAAISGLARPDRRLDADTAAPLPGSADRRHERPTPASIRPDPSERKPMDVNIPMPR